MKKSFFYPIFFMIMVTVIFGGVLAFLDNVTKETVAFQAQTRLQEQILGIFQVPFDATDKEAVVTAFEQNITTEDFEGQPLYIYQKGTDQEQFAVPFDGPGLWGYIQGYIGINAELNQLSGIAFIRQEETPGLGGRIDEPEYKNQFKGLDLPGDTGGTLIVSRPAPGGNVDGIAGATQTSDFVVNMINEDLKHFIDSKKGA